MKNISKQGRIQKLYENVETQVYIDNYKMRKHEEALKEDESFEHLKEEIISIRGESYFDSLMLRELDIEGLKRSLRSIKLKEYMSMGNGIYPNYNIDVPSDKVLLFHNTSEENAESVALNGLKASAGASQGRGKDGDFVWATTVKGLKGYGGYTVAFMVDKEKAEPYRVNNTEYTLPFDIPVEDIVFIDEPIEGLGNYRESDVKKLVGDFGSDKVAEVLAKKTNLDSDTIGEMISKSLEESEQVTRDVLHRNPVTLSVYYKDGDGNDRHSEQRFDNLRSLFKYVKECGGFKSAFSGMMYFIKSDYNGNEYYLVRDRFAKEGWKWQDCNGYDLPGQTKTFKPKVSILPGKEQAIKDRYEAGDGTYMIELNDGWVTSYGTNYIQADSESDAIFELNHHTYNMEDNSLEESELWRKLEPQVDRDDSDNEVIERSKDLIKSGKHRPILINSNNEVIDGNHTLTAYQELGVKPPMLYRGERRDFYAAVPKSDCDALKAIYTMVDEGTATLVESEVDYAYGLSKEELKRRIKDRRKYYNVERSQGELYNMYNSIMRADKKREEDKAIRDFEKERASKDAWKNLPSADIIKMGIEDEEREMNKLDEDLSYMDKRDVLLSLVKEADKDGIDDILYWLANVGYVRDDKRCSKKHFVSDVIKNNYVLDPKSVLEKRNNKDIELSIMNGLHKDTEEYLHESALLEANLKDLIDDSKATDPKRIELAKTIYTDYKGVDSDGTLLFESDSQTRSSLVHRQRVFYPGFFDLLDTVDAGDEITEEQAVEVITGDLMVDCSCFVGDTLIDTSKGFKYISDIEVGDMVLTHTGKYKKVVKVFEPYESSIVKVSLGTRDLFCTPNHPFYTVEGEWIPIEECENKTLVCYEKESGTVSPIGNPIIEKLEDTALVYNFEVEDDNSYCVGQNRVVVHNCESFLYYAWAYKSWTNDYGLMKEPREPKRNNVELKGGACKHVLSVLDLINRSDTLFGEITKDLNVLFQRYKKRSNKKQVEQPEDNTGE